MILETIAYTGNFDYNYKINKNTGGIMKKILLTFVLAIIFISAFALQISEFIVTPTSSEALELHNETGSTIELSDYRFILIGLSSNDTVTLPSGTLAADGYVYYDPANDLGTAGLSNSGMQIIITDLSYVVEDELSYGSMGNVPVPIYDWSTARVSSTGDNAVDFNYDVSPTIGSANNAPSTALGSGTVFFNEVYPDSVNSYADQFIELYNSGVTGVDISDWCIVCGDDYYVPSSTVLAADGYFVIPKADFPSFFYLDYNYEHLYLFNETMQRIDQIGWDYIKTDSSFACRPNGVRAVFDGWNSASTPDFEVYAPTEGSVNSLTGIVETVKGDYDYTVNMLNGIGIEVAGNMTNAVIEIMDVNGRVIYSSNFKNMIYSAKSGVYFVNIKGDGFSNSHKVEVIK